MSNSARSKASAAKQAAKEQRQKGRIQITIDGVPIELSPHLEDAVQRAHKGLLEQRPEEMTTTEAAVFLDVSRPFVIKLTKQGELSCRMVGSHRRIPTRDLEKYREKMFVRAKDAADEITRMSEESGLYEPEKPSPNRE